MQFELLNGFHPIWEKDKDDRAIYTEKLKKLEKIELN